METVVKLDFYEFLPGVFFVKTIPIKGLEGDYGVLIKTDEYFLTLDLNLHPRVINQFYQFVDNCHDVHINTHCHIDHIAYLINIRKILIAKFSLPSPMFNIFDLLQKACPTHGVCRCKSHNILETTCD